ncbi:AAA family ATPase [Granulicella sp. dw_53]|uniref:AAA family ATPase n=1 Tax=Granulicella sp. dw_53 TaxID=2719792 RepID=UPI0021033C8F|nr:AAA family ATPase [Granulicella sp. dw_53]
MAISGYRSLRDLVLPLGRISLVTGANGSGKSSLYKALRLLGDAALNSVVASLAREGGLPSALWAGPETIARSVRQGDHDVEGTASGRPASLKLGIASDVYGYSIELGYPPPAWATAFSLDPAIKRECIWHGGLYRKASTLVDRHNNFVHLPGKRTREDVTLTQNLSAADSMLASIADPQRAPEMLAVRESIRRWRFYDGFRADIASPVRTPQIGTFTPVLSNDGTDLPAALQTILEIGDKEALARTVNDAFPGSRIQIEVQAGRFEVKLRQHGLLRGLSAAELSDGTLRFLLWTAALLTPRPPELMVLNEPETSLHPDLIPALGRLIQAASERSQIIVVSHAQSLIEDLSGAASCKRLHLEKSFGETTLAGADLFNTPLWHWPSR